MNSSISGFSLSSNAKQLSMFLTAISIILFAFSIISFDIENLFINELLNDLGIVQALPWSFWVSISLLTIASAIVWVSRHECKSLPALQICMFITMFWLYPFILGSTLSGTRYIFGLHQLTLYIQRYGHLDFISQWYHNWPAFNIFETVILEVSGFQNVDLLLITSTVVMQFLLVPPLYFFFRQTLGPGNYCWAAIWFMILFNWTAQTYFSPQALGLFLMILLITLTVKSLENHQNSTLSNRIVFIIICAALTITHLFTALAALFITLANLIINRKGFLNVTFLLGIFILVWMIYSATAIFDSKIPAFFERAMKFENMWFWNMSRAYTGSEGHLIVVTTRTWFTVIAGIIALLGLALSWKFRGKSDKAIFYIGIGIVLMIPFQFYEGEFFSRLLFYIIPVLSYFAVKLLGTRSTAAFLFILLIVLIPFGIISLHGNQLIDYVSPNQLSYWDFLEDKTSRGNLALGGIPMAWTIGYADRYISSYDSIRSLGSKWNGILKNRQWLIWNMPNYLGITGYEEEGFRLLTDFPDGARVLREQANDMRTYTLFYNNGEAIGYYDSGNKI